MRLNYIVYRIRDVANNKMHWMDLHQTLKTYCSIPDPKLRNIFRNEDDRVFLLHQTDRLFLFIQTNDSKVIEKINTDSLELKNIEELLGENDALGIAAFVFVSDNFVGYCAPQLAPKYSVFFRFLNELFEHLGLCSYEVTSEPLLTQGAIGDVQKAHYVSRSSIIIEAGGTIGEHIRAALGVPVDEFKELEGLEVVFRPVKGKSIKKIAAAAVQKPGMRQASVRAKMKPDDRMLDLYLETSGPIKDEIDASDKTRIYDRITRKISQNAILKAKLNELSGNPEVHSVDIDAIRRLDNSSAWTARLPGLLLVRPTVAPDTPPDK